eukprot:6492769-Amphidinium_carterae.1
MGQYRTSSVRCCCIEGAANVREQGHIVSHVPFSKGCRCTNFAKHGPAGNQRIAQPQSSGENCAPATFVEQTPASAGAEEVGGNQT